MRDVAWAPSFGLPMNTLASAGQDGKVMVWTERQEGEPLGRAGAAWALAEGTARINGWAVARAATHVHAGSGGCWMWRRCRDAALDCQASKVGCTSNAWPLQQAEQFVATSSSPARAPASAGGWDRHVLHDFGAAVWRVSWSVSGNILSVSDANNQVTLWKEAADGQWQQITQ